MTGSPPPSLTARERIPTHVLDESYEVSRTVAREIAALVRERAAAGRACVLGLPTGSTPMAVYQELVRLHRDEGLSFANVVTFNLDEYFPMQPDELQSYVRFMREQLLDHVDIDPANVHIPDGTIPVEDVPRFCAGYEAAIERSGGLDLLLLGVGRTGHIGFNEPGSSRTSRTRLITLDRVTRIDAASDFFGEENVPRRAITMGVGTILAARRIALMALGEHKARVIAEAVEGPVTDAVAASFLQEHPNAAIFLDRAAAAELTREKCPWTVGPVAWNDDRVHTAVIWLARTTGKPILKLTDEDYNEHRLQDLVAERGPAYDINLAAFRRLQRTVTGWPAGRPAPGAERPEPRRVLVFSPHPDDDVISMGGTLARLVEQGHEVHVAYQTSGSLAVFDEDAIRFADFGEELCRMLGLADERVERFEAHIEAFLRTKTPGQVDSDDVRMIKALIRRGEARAAARACGVAPDRLHFLDLPFYETGRAHKNPLGPADIALVAGLLERLAPHQVYVAGDLSDPHGTHRTCLSAILRALDGLRGAPWFDGLEVWLYRGAWQEWAPEAIDMAVPLSPKELQRKIHAIFKHESQKDKALFPGVDDREFWQRAEDRNRATARLYDALGLAEYEAIEAFRGWDGVSLVEPAPVGHDADATLPRDAAALRPSAAPAQR